jgi:hypothetical protein
MEVKEIVIRVVLGKIEILFELSLLLFYESVSKDLGFYGLSVPVDGLNQDQLFFIQNLLLIVPVVIHSTASVKKYVF